MNDQQEALLHRCIKQLELIKCEFAIVTPDGERHGTLKVDDTTEDRNNFKQYGYKDVCAAMQVGDTYSFDECVGRDKVAVNNYQAAIGSCLNKLYGGGSYATARTGPGKDVIWVKRLA